MQSLCLMENISAAVTLFANQQNNQRVIIGAKSGTERDFLFTQAIQ